MRTDFGAEIKDAFRSKDNFRILMFVNIAVFIFIVIGNLFVYFAKTSFDVVHWLGVPATIGVLARRPWTVFTYMFVHVSFLHIFFNLLVYYWFGKIFLQYLSQRQFMGMYILGGLAGALLFVVAYNQIPVLGAHPAVAIGASASIMAIVFSVAALVPNLRVYVRFVGNVKLKDLALIIVLLDLVGIPLGNAGGHIAHLGGAIIGAIFAVSYKKGTDITIFLSRFWQWIKDLFKNEPKIKVSRGGAQTKNEPKSNSEQEKINKILEKVKKSGYTSLTKEEKELLFRKSNK